jgi:hypothetical protein
VIEAAAAAKSGPDELPKATAMTLQQIVLTLARATVSAW